VELGCRRERAAARVRITVPETSYGVFWEERHFYDALQTDYWTNVHRVTGDTASTDCPLEYVAAATVCELLEGRPGEWGAILDRATKDLALWDAQVGPAVRTPTETYRSTPYLARA
jgi:hypothetical protein